MANVCYKRLLDSFIVVAVLVREVQPNLKFVKFSSCAAKRFDGCDCQTMQQTYW